MSAAVSGEAPLRHHALLLRHAAPAAPARPLARPGAPYDFAAEELLPRPQPPPQPPVPAPPAPDPLPGLLAAERVAGFAEGEAAGRAAAAASQEAALLDTLRLAAAQLAEAAPAARALAEEAARSVGALVLGALQAALPALAARHAGAELEGFLARLLPALDGEPELALHVAPALSEAAAARCATLPACRVVADPALEPGDAVLRWRDGLAERRAATARAAVAALLAGFGLDAPAEPNPETR
ncbi:hypothetical protein [Teichococcus aestuarii]|uniref:Flagellar assembly protein FliH/Type III secretion system HrpE domain-containing protein n=1 Tax=Teichococcus aestuarii TaxID=568898 RepID=A0A2U1V2W6_9PROT|nr:hypothetical protein [Pseudoroseomonas aestuarii]PWC28250.1 hypothetical protein CR165_13215 [Pseudoroseomonas aestuarii]